MLGRRRGSKAVAFSPGQVARSLAQASRIAAIVRALEDLDRTTGEKRRELERLRLEGARAVLTEMVGAAKPSRRGAGRERGQAEPGGDADQRARVIRLGVALAERLGVPPRRPEILRQALEVHDIGKAWLEDVLVPRTAFLPLGRAAQANAYARHGAEILASLDWPPPVVELVRMHLAWWNGQGEPPGLSGTRIPMEARIMAIVAAFAQLTGGRTAAEDMIDEALVELTRQAGQRFDPSVVEALAAILASDAPGGGDGRA